MEIQEAFNYVEVETKDYSKMIFFNSFKSQDSNKSSIFLTFKAKTGLEQIRDCDWWRQIFVKVET